MNQIGGRAVVLDFSFSFTHAGQQSTANLEQVRAQYGRAELTLTWVADTGDPPQPTVERSLLTEMVTRLGRKAP